MSKPLGELTTVDPRGLWPNEATDFTPWLAKEENIEQLGRALGIELELEQTEVAVGPYSADILARDTGTGNYVVIENQLDKTNHDHLGKVLTYVSVLDAKTCVWIATGFTDEHRRALDWLNDHSSDEVAFFGVRIELWQIDQSRPAVRFNVLSRPAEIVRLAAAQKASGELSETKRLQLDWWTAFRDALVDARFLPSFQSPRPQYWYDVALGRSGIHLSNTANTYDKKIGVRVYLQQKYGGDAALEQLLEAKQEIENEIGESLLWNPNPENKDKTIALYRSADLSQRDRWPEFIAWMVERTKLFREAFAPRVRALDLGASPSDDSDVEMAPSNNG